MNMIPLTPLATALILALALTGCAPNTPDADAPLAERYKNVIDRRGARTLCSITISTITSASIRSSISAPGTATCCRAGRKAWAVSRPGAADRRVHQLYGQQFRSAQRLSRR